LGALDNPGEAMNNDYRKALTIDTEHLRTVAELITMRYPLRGPETRRVARLRSLLGAASEVNRSLSIFLEHALVHCHGTAGTSDLTADTVALDQALRAFSVEVESVARDYDDSVNRPHESGLEDPADELAAMRRFMPWHAPSQELPAS
jgi:hypothetical protein